MNNNNNYNSSFLCGEDKYGNIRGYCLICKEKCPSYSQTGIDDLRCSRCQCGASSHKLFTIADYDLKGFLSLTTSEILPRLNMSITEDSINFNGLVVMYKLLDPNANRNQFAWLYQLLREAGFTILKLEIKQLRKNETNTSMFDQMKPNISNYYNNSVNSSNSNNNNNGDNMLYKGDINYKKDVTFVKLSKMEEKLKMMSSTIYADNTHYNTMQHPNNNTNSNDTTKRKYEKNYYIEFNSPILIICISINRVNSIKHFEQFVTLISSSDSTLRSTCDSQLKLIYYSKTKLKALWDVQTIFPELFKVNKFFQFLSSKIKREHNYTKALSLYKDALFANSFNLVQIRNFPTLNALREYTHSEILSRSKSQNIPVSNIKDFLDIYLTNPKLHGVPCSILQVSNVGIDKEISTMSTTLAFNNNISITTYDEEDEYEEISNFYFNASVSNNISSYEHIILIFRPFVLRSGLNEILLNIFRINKYYILSRKTTRLSKAQLYYLYSHEFDLSTEAKLSFAEYEHMMSDSNVEIVVMSKFSAFVDLSTLLGFVKQEINVNMFNIMDNSLFYTNATKGDSRGIPVSGEKNCFKDISSLINVNEIMESIANDKKKLYVLDLYKQLQIAKTNLLKFSSFFNLFVYCNLNHNTNSEEVNYFFPKFGDIQEAFLLVKKYNYQLVKETLVLMKFEILEVKEVLLNRNEIEMVFGCFKGTNVVSDYEYDKCKEYLMNNTVMLVRLVKPGAYLELKKIVGKVNCWFVKMNNNNNNSECSNNVSSIKQKEEKVFDVMKHNTFLLNCSEYIEHFYPKANDKIHIIEGAFIHSLNEASRAIIIDIMKSCIKCTVGENMRMDTIANTNSLIERYLNFYHFQYDNTYKEYFIYCLHQYMFPKYKKNINIDNNYYEYIKYIDEYSPSTSTTSFNSVDNVIAPSSPQISFFIESANLGFFEVRIPVIHSPTSTESLLAKTYSYHDNHFYNEFKYKHPNDNVLLISLPFEQGSLQPFIQFNNNNNITQQQQHDMNYTLMLSGLNEQNSKCIQNESEIQKRLLYTTKYISTKLFYKQCMNTNPKIRITPHNYHYRIKPDDINMKIQRIYEVEEFGGLFFMEMAIQDYMKYRPPERGERIINGEIVELRRDNAFLIDEQFSLSAFLWGRKLSKICTVVEDLNGSPCDNYGPLVYSPKHSGVVGVINADFIKEYEMYLYVNMLEDIRQCGYCAFDRESFALVEKKLFMCINSDIFKQTRVKENVRLVPVRIMENNLRVCANSPSSTTYTVNEMGNVAIDPKKEMRFHTMFKNNEGVINKSVHDVKENGDSVMMDTAGNTLYNGIQRSAGATVGYNNNNTVNSNSNSNSSKDNNNTQNKITNEILSKNVNLIDLYCYNGMKYHAYAALLFLINVYFRKINRKTHLITLDLKDIAEKEKEYDLFIEALLKGFYNHSHINYKQFNDSNRYNAYNIEYFFYCIKEMKFIVNEIDILKTQLNSSNAAVIKDKIAFMQRSLEIIFNEAKECKLQQSKDDLDDYEYTYAPKERYHIPMYMKEKWEMDMENEKYMRTVKVDYSFLKNLDKISDPEERKIFSSTGFGMKNDYYFVKKTMLREPEPQPEKFILLEKKKKDNTKMVNKVFGTIIKRQVGNMKDKEDDDNGREKKETTATTSTMKAKQANVIAKNLGLLGRLNINK